MENVKIDEERSDSEISTSTEITKVSDIREVSESEILETSSSYMTETDTNSDCAINSVFSFKYDADDEGVTITKPSEIREVSESGSLETSSSELTSTDTNSDTNSVFSFKYDADDEGVTDFEGWTQDDPTTSTSSIYITPDEYSYETELPVLDAEQLKYLNEDRFEYDTKNGKFYFMDHVAARNFGIIMNPIWYVLTRGCEVTRTTGQMVKEQGNFKSVYLQYFNVPIWYAPVLRPFVMGIATK